METTKRMIPKWMIKKLHVLYARYGLSEEQYRALILELTDGRTDTTKELTYAESQYLAGYITGANTTIKPVAERLIEKSLKWQRGAETPSADWSRHLFLGCGKRLPSQPSHCREASLRTGQRRAVRTYPET